MRPDWSHLQSADGLAKEPAACIWLPMKGVMASRGPWNRSRYTHFSIAGGSSRHGAEIKIVANGGSRLEIHRAALFFVPDAAAQPRERSQNVKVALAFEGHLNCLIFQEKRPNGSWGRT